MRQTRNSIYSSAIALVLCIVMLTGTTFAWFTDIATSSDNVIQSGRLDAELYWSNELLASDSDEWIDASGNAVFTHNNWEPGYTDVKYIKVKNNGTLNFKWKLTVEADGPVTSLSDVIEVYYVNPVTTQLTSLEGLASVGTLTEVIMDKTNSTGRLTPGQDAILAIAFHMDELSGNEYQDTSLCDNGFSLKLLATQDVGENDSFGDDYDLGADWEEGSVNFTASASLSQVPLIYGSLAGNVTIGDQNGVSAFIPTGVKVADGASSLDLSINRVDDDNITLDDGATSSSLDVHIEGVAADNTVPMTVHLGAVLQPGLDVTELKLYHIENDTPVLMTRVNTSADFAVHNQYTYNPTTGEVSIYVASFSVFSAVKTSADEWDGEAVADGFDSGTGTEGDPYIIETAAQLVYFRNQVDAGVTYAGQFVKLGKDIDLADKPFDPIGFGYWKEAKVENDVDKNTVFMGTFDGGNHTIYNLYQNGWELDPDKTNYSTYTYSTAGAGLFASIKNATIKNLAISGAEVVFECVDMGIVVGYAQGECHFENIVVTNANIANYNRYTGGLVGEVSGGPYGIDPKKGYSHTFKNITIDSTVTVSGLWGSFGCGMGGVIGGKWGDATVLMENVISAPKMDVYNDVVSAYQWYAFRGCGMLIGHTEEPYSDGRTSGIATANFLTCENVKVYYGDWVNYTYYEFANQTDAEGNTLWYSNYPWVRAEAGEYCEAFSNIRYGIPQIGGVNVTDLSEEDFNAAVTSTTKIIFNQLYGADRGMYGQAAHDGVTVIENLGETKTIYIYNDQNWENLKLYYWYRNGEDTWSNVSEDGVSMDNMELSNFANVYRLILPAYIDGLKITADGENATTSKNVVEFEDNKAYNLDWSHAHLFVEDVCECGAVQFTFGLNGDAEHTESNTEIKQSSYSVGSYVLNLEDIEKVYTATDNMGNSCLKLGSSSSAGNFKFTVPDDVVKVYIHVAKYKENTSKFTVNGTTYNLANSSNDGKYDAIEIDTSSKKVISVATGSGGYRCMIDAIIFELGEWAKPHEHDFSSPTCTQKATCSICGITDGETLEHDYTGSNPYICVNNCGIHSLPEAGSTITIQQALWIAETLEDGKETSAKYIITGTIDDKDHPSSTGATTITDGERSIYITNIYNVDGSIRHDEFATKLRHGDIITVSAKIAKNGAGEAQLHETRLASHTDLDPIDHNCDFCGAENVTEHNYVDGTCDCGATEPVEPTHECESKCAECGKCTDAECTEDACADKCLGHSATPAWTLTDISDIKADDIVVIVWTKGNTSWALTSANGSSKAPTAVVVTVEGDKLTGEIADALKWNISNNNGNLTIYPNGTTTKWLYCTNSNDGVRVGTNANKVFTIDETSGYLKNTATSRYVGVYTTNPDVRCYTSTTTNISNQTLAFYVYNEGNSGSEGGETPSCEHTNTIGIGEAREATCVDDGITAGEKCADCDYVITEQETIPATGHTFVNGKCECGAEESVSLVNATLSFANKAQRTEYSTSKQVWEQNSVKLINDKDSSTSNVADYANPARFYKSSKITIEGAGMKVIKFTCNSSDYATALKNSIASDSNYNVSVSGSDVTVTFVNAVDSFVIENLTGGQVRINSLVVNPN